MLWKLIKIILFILGIYMAYMLITGGDMQNISFESIYADIDGFIKSMTGYGIAEGIDTIKNKF